jgi:rhodanese-related sulfurtransferase
MNLDRPTLGIPILIVLGAALGLAYNGLMKDPLPWISHPRTVLTLEDVAAGESDSSVAEGSEPDKPATSTGEPEANSDPENAPAPIGTEPVAGKTPTADAATPPAEDPGKASGVPESEFPVMVSLEKAKQLYDRGLLRVLDARELEEYAEGHIRGAECAPYDELGGDNDWLEAMAKEPRVLLVYCGGGGCDLALNLGFAVSQAGHRRVLVYEDGYPVWNEAGFPVATGESP